MYNKQDAYNLISNLVERFEEQLPSYKKSEYNETLTRRDFIDPLFKALGWDMDNSFGYAEAYREVIHEDRIKVAGASKAPDYSFKLPGGKRLFFLEAKKPFVQVKSEVQPAYQLRRYGWSAKMPISVITDFEEFAIYDCTKKPTLNDKTSTGRIRYLTYKEYLKEFDFLWETFSKEKVLKGGFDKFISTDTAKKGTATVDREFLLSLDEWRTRLAVNISKRNPNLNEDELNFAVQQLIDRIIFLRIAEDRKVEDYGNLKNSVKGGDAYLNLFKLFKEADRKYNSGLFDFKKDKISEDLGIDFKVINGIIDEMYFPISPYEFSVLSVEILGSAYEQFLGKQITLDKNHRAKIEEKPEVRKAGGVYYTPQYIVDYIVQNTVGKLVVGKTPKDITKLKLLDPACGSGSFLLGAYQFLMTWHQLYYKPEFDKLTKIASSTEYTRKQREDAIKERSKLPLTPEGSLTTQLKKDILLNNIFGVDLDSNAVEVTKLSLLLKCMEGETRSSMSASLSFGERILPTLDQNIKSGNSLIDVDVFDSELDFNEERKIRPFSWERNFPNVFKQGGFDVVIGNPPYGAVLLPKEDEYLRKKYPISNYQLDTYVLFIAKAQHLLKQGARLGFIIPSAWVASTFDVKMRKFLIEKTDINSFVICPKKTFKDATVETCIIITANGKKTTNFPIERWDKNSNSSYTLDASLIKSSTDFTFPVYADPKAFEIVNKVRKAPCKLRDFVDLTWGVKVYQKGKGVPKQTAKESEHRLFHSDVKRKNSHRPLIGGSEVCRYNLCWNGGYIDYGPWLAEPRKPEWFNGEMILVREVTSQGVIQATFVKGEYVFSNSVDGIFVRDKSVDPLVILGLMNSKLFSYYHLFTSPNAFKGTFPKVLLQDLKELPVPKLDKLPQNVYLKLKDCVKNLLHLTPEFSIAKLEQRKQEILSKINHYDNTIDKIIYAMYGLTDQEIEIVEQENRRE